jgi:hypothetical protein
VVGRGTRVDDGEVSKIKVHYTHVWECHNETPSQSIKAVHGGVHLSSQLHREYNRRIEVQDSPDINERTCLKNSYSRKGWGVWVRW